MLSQESARKAIYSHTNVIIGISGSRIRRRRLIYVAGSILIRGRSRLVSLSASPLTFLMTSSSNRRSLSMSSSSRSPALPTASRSWSKREALISMINARKSCSRVAASRVDPEAPTTGDVEAMQDSPEFSERETCLPHGSGEGSVMVRDRSGYRHCAGRTDTSPVASAPEPLSQGQPASPS